MTVMYPAVTDLCRYCLKSGREGHSADCPLVKARGDIPNRITHPGREPECLHGVAVSGSCYECASATLKDSGTRREFDTGAVRDGARGKGRFDLNPIYGELLIAQQMEAGAAKYSARNWEQGMPLSVFANSAKRHLAKLIAGFDDEPHLAAALWNLSCLAEGQKRIELGLWPKSLDDLPKTYAGQDPGF